MSHNDAGHEPPSGVVQAMLRHGRKPMSMSHGDFDYDYLEALALDPRTGAPRFVHLSFADSAGASPVADE